MSNLLEAGETLPVQGPASVCKVIELLSESGQGQVQVQRVAFEGNRYTAKWYFQTTNELLPRKRIEISV